MYCRNCGSQMEESAKFCPSCGASQENKELYTEQISPKIEKSLSEVKIQISKGKQSGNLYKIAGWISVAISLLFIPVLFGAIGVIMGYFMVVLAPRLPSIHSTVAPSKALARLVTRL